MEEWTEEQEKQEAAYQNLKRLWQEISKKEKSKGEIKNGKPTST